MVLRVISGKYPVICPVQPSAMVKFMDILIMYWIFQPRRWYQWLFLAFELALKAFYDAAYRGNGLYAPW